MSKRIFVYADWEPLSEPTLVGVLNSDTFKGKEVFSFEYDSNWLKLHQHSFFDPDINLYKGRQYPPSDKALFGVFTDSCPDRWGRMLMNRREAIKAKKENRTRRTLLESDYLLGIQDALRIGALRFKSLPDGPFLADSKTYSIPPWTTTRELEQAAYILESEEITPEEEIETLKTLLAPGSSLGGARPKATVQAQDGSLWIAKFPSRHDEFDSGAWEMVCHELAGLCGISVPKAKCIRYSPKGSTFLVKRFDRSPKCRRIHFISAMTALSKTDGSNAQDGLSYLDIVQCIEQHSSSPKEDLLELWKRIVFSIAVSNTDDHLRNHGFLYDGKGLRLSPMYDVNPNPTGVGLSLNIDDRDNSLDYEVAIEASKYFQIKTDAANSIVQEMKNHIKEWQTVANTLGIPRSEIMQMRNCFRY